MRIALTLPFVLVVVACGGDGQGPTVDGDPDNPPPGALQIAAVDLPAMETGGTAAFAATLLGRPNQPVEFILSASSGAFAPAMGSVVLDGNGAGLIASQYTAPDAAGTYAHLVSVADDAGATAGRAFSAVVLPAEAHIGYDEPLPGTMTLAGGIYAQPIHVPAAATLLRFGVIGMVGTRARLALYSESIERPYQLVEGTAVFSMTNGRAEHAVAPRSLAPGDYWIAILLESAGKVRTDPDGAPLTMYYGAAGFGSTAPPTFPVNDILSHAPMNLYLVVDMN